MPKNALPQDEQDLVDAHLAAPSAPEPLQALATYYLEHQQLRKALSRLQALIKTHPKFVPAYISLANYYLDKSKVRDALKVLKQGYKAVPRAREFWSLLGLCYLHLNHKKEALPLFKKAARIGDVTARYHVKVIEGKARKTVPRESVRELFDEYASSFDYSLVKELSYKTPTRMYEAVKSYAKRPNHFSHAIDLGCGTGLSGVAFSSLCDRITGVDLSANMIKEARKKRVYDRIYHDDVVSYLYKSRIKYDLFISSDVIIYLGELDALFAQVTEHAAPDALFVFSTEKANRRDMVLRTTVRYAHKREYVKRIAEQYGLKMVKARKTKLRREGYGWIYGDIIILKKVS